MENVARCSRSRLKARCKHRVDDRVHVSQPGANAPCSTLSKRSAHDTTDSNAIHAKHNHRAIHPEHPPAQAATRPHWPSRTRTRTHPPRHSPSQPPKHACPLHLPTLSPTHPHTRPRTHTHRQRPSPPDTHPPNSREAHPHPHPSPHLSKISFPAARFRVLGRRGLPLARPRRGRPDDRDEEAFQRGRWQCDGAIMR